MAFDFLRPYARNASIVILLVNGIGAYAGGTLLMYDPTGEVLGMNTRLLANSPFTDFFIPGFTLFICNGLLSTIALWNVLRREDNYGQWITTQGAVLGGWIVVQLFMIREFFAPMHITFLLMSLMLIGSGMSLTEPKRSHRHSNY